MGQPKAAAWLAGFRRGTFARDGLERTCYRYGSGPPVIVLHELLGLTRAVAAFARRLGDRAGVTVHLPVLFGNPCGTENVVDCAGAIAQVCVRREFTLFTLGRSSPAVDIVRAFATQILSEGPEDQRYGVIGLCLTGNFALAMMCDRRLTAPVMSEPAIPFRIFGANRADPGVDPDALACAKARCEAPDTMLGFRFERDRISPRARLGRLNEELRPGFEGREIRDRRWYAHSVFTTHYRDQAGTPTRDAFDRLVVFLKEKL